MTDQSTATPTPQGPPRTCKRHLMRRHEIVTEMRRYDDMADLYAISIERCWWPWNRARMRREQRAAREKADLLRLVLKGAK